MSHTRQTTRFHGPAAATALALGGLLLTGACGTVHAGAAAGAAEPAVAVSSPVAAAPGTTSATPAPAARAARVRTPLALPVTAVSTSGAITGTVSSGMLGCLFVRTDAGQVFNVAGAQTARLRQLLPTATFATPATGGVDTRGVGGGVSGSSGSLPGMRISAAGTLRAAPAFCGASYTFTIATLHVESLPLR